MKQSINNYNGFADIYDIITTPDFETSLWFFLKIAEKEIGRNLLELGCGTGKYAIEFAKFGFNVTGMDFSKKMLEIAGKKAGKEKVKIFLEQKDLANFCYENKFNFITSFDVLQYILSEKSLEKVFVNSFNSLKEGGIFVFDYLTPKNFENKKKYGGYGGKAKGKYYIWQDFCDKNIWQMQLTIFFQNGRNFSKKTENVYAMTMPLQKVLKLLKKAGFSRVKVFDGNGKSKPSKNSEFWYFIAKR